MVQFKSTWLLVASIFASSFVSPSKDLQAEVKKLTNQVQELNIQLTETELCYEGELGEMREQLHKSAELVSDPLNLAKMLYSRKNNLATQIKKQGRFVGTNLELRHSGVDPRISPHLYAAFLDCLGPTVEVNSARRCNNPKSSHFTGEALDIRYDNAGIAFAEWLISKEGTEWRKRWGIYFYIEASSSKNPIFKRLGGSKFEPFHFVNRWATGPHIHLYIKEEKIEIEINKGTTGPHISE